MQGLGNTLSVPQHLAPCRNWYSKRIRCQSLSYTWIRCNSKSLGSLLFVSHTKGLVVQHDIPCMRHASALHGSVLQASDIVFAGVFVWLVLEKVQSSSFVCWSTVSGPGFRGRRFLIHGKLDLKRCSL